MDSTHATGPVGRFVQAAHRALRALRFAEAALWGVAAALVVAAAAVDASGGVLSGEVFLLGGLLGGLAATAVARATLPTPEGVVRELDARTERRWALVAAWERERSGRGGEFDGLLSRRARAGLTLSESLAGHATAAVPAVVAPLVAAALLGLALAPADRPGEAVANLAAGAARELGRAVAAAGSEELDPTRRAELAALVRELERTARQAPLETADGAARRLDELGAELVEKARGVDPTGELAAAVERAVQRLGAAERRAREATGAAKSPGPGPSGDGEGGESPGTAAGPATEGGAAPAGPGAAPARADDGASGVEGGSRVRGWLDPHERALVEAWVEARRRAALGSDGG